MRAILSFYLLLLSFSFSEEYLLSSCLNREKKTTAPKSCAKFPTRQNDSNANVCIYSFVDAQQPLTLTSLLRQTIEIHVCRVCLHFFFVARHATRQIRKGTIVTTTVWEQTFCSEFRINVMSSVELVSNFGRSTHSAHVWLLISPAHVCIYFSNDAVNWTFRTENAVDSLNSVALRLFHKHLFHV